MGGSSGGRHVGGAAVGETWEGASRAAGGGTNLDVEKGGRGWGAVKG